LGTRVPGRPGPVTGAPDRDPMLKQLPEPGYGLFSGR